MPKCKALFSALALALATQAPCAAAADARATLKGISSVRIANYGAPSTLLEGRERVLPVVEELGAMRGRSWRRGDTTLTCYSTVTLMSGKKMAAQYRVRPDFIVERALEKGQSSYSLEIGEADLPVLRKLLASIPPAKGCP
jgi:hypothetical protein